MDIQALGLARPSQVASTYFLLGVTVSVGKRSFVDSPTFQSVNVAENLQGMQRSQIAARQSADASMPPKG